MSNPRSYAPQTEVHIGSAAREVLDTHEVSQMYGRLKTIVSTEECIRKLKTRLSVMLGDLSDHGFRIVTRREVVPIPASRPYQERVKAERARPVRSNPQPFSEISSDQCSACVGQDGSGDYLACAKPVMEGSPFCFEHRHNAFRNQ